MSGSFQKQKSNSQSTSQELGIGEQLASSFGEQGSQSTGSSISTGTSASSSQSNQSVAFEDLFRSLYGGATGAAADVDTGAISGASSKLFNAGTGFLETLTGVGSEDTTTAQLGALKTSLGDFFNEQLLPGITREGVSTGTFGGSRDAVAKELAAKAVAGQFAGGAAQILGQRDAAKTNAAGTGLSALQALLQVGTAGETAGLQPYQILASILGGPTTLTNASSIASAEDLATQISNSFSFGKSGSQSYGYNYNTGSSQSTGMSSGYGISGGIGYSNASPGREPKG